MTENIIPGIASSAKGAYFGPREQGWATVLVDRYPGYWYGLGRGIGAIAKAKAAKQKALQDKILKMKPEDHGRQFQDALDNEYQAILTDYAKGDMGEVEFVSRVGEYMTLAQRSIQVQKDAEDMIKTANDKDLPIKTDRFIAYNNAKLAGDGTIKSLKQLSKEEFNQFAWLDETGGSELINATKAFNIVANEFPNDVKQTNFSLGGWGSAPGGGWNVNDTATYNNLPVFAERVGDTGIQVKSAQDLINGGVLGMFEGDRFTDRVLVDEAKKNIAIRDGYDNWEDVPDDIVYPIDKAEALQDQLVPIIRGEIKRTNRRFVFTERGASNKGSEYETGLKLWWKHFTSDNPDLVTQAYEYIGGGRTLTLANNKYNVVSNNVGSLPWESRPEEIAKAAFGGRSLNQLTDAERNALYDYYNNEGQYAYVDPETRKPIDPPHAPHVLELDFAPEQSNVQPTQITPRQQGGMERDLRVIVLRSEGEETVNQFDEKVKGEDKVQVYIVDAKRTPLTKMMNIYNAAENQSGAGYHRGIETRPQYKKATYPGGRPEEEEQQQGVWDAESGNILIEDNRQ